MELHLLALMQSSSIKINIEGIFMSHIAVRNEAGKSLGILHGHSHTQRVVLTYRYFSYCVLCHQRGKVIWNRNVSPLRLQALTLLSIKASRYSSTWHPDLMLHQETKCTSTQITRVDAEEKTFK